MSTKRDIEKAVKAEKRNRQEALRFLIDLAQGYNARPEQIAAVAEQYGVQAWDLEGMYFDEMERAADE